MLQLHFVSFFYSFIPSFPFVSFHFFSFLFVSFHFFSFLFISFHFFSFLFVSFHFFSLFFIFTGGHFIFRRYCSRVRLCGVTILMPTASKFADALSFLQKKETEYTLAYHIYLTSSANQLRLCIRGPPFEKQVADYGSVRDISTRRECFTEDEPSCKLWSFSRAKSVNKLTYSSRNYSGLG
jgi:hypothetical protein